MQGGPALSCRRYVRPSLALIPALPQPYIDKCKCRGKPSTMIGESSAWMSGWM